MSTLVIGGTGFIGPRVMRRLVERGQEVTCMDIHLPTASFAGLEDTVNFIWGDITQFEDVVKAILEGKPDRIINLAYVLGGDESNPHLEGKPDRIINPSYVLGGGESNPHQQMRINVLGMDNCLEAARLCEVQRVVYASSIAVSGEQIQFGERLVNEDDPKYGTSQYAVHKIFNEYQAEQYIRNYGMSITGIRPANVTGPDKVRGSTDHVQVITLPAQGAPVHLPWKSLMRLPIHVEDIAEVFVRVTLADSSRYPIYFSGGTPISLGELADVVREFIPDAKISFENEGGKEGVEGSGIYLVDNSRLRQEFEIEYPPFHTRVRDIINDIRRMEGMPLV